MSDPQGMALVTGASVGIGRDLAFLLAQNRHDLVITARNQTQLESLAGELRSRFSVRVEVIVQDLAQPQAADAILAEVSARDLAIDILINNAGFGGNGRFDQEDPDEILRMLQVNVVALTQLTRLFLPAMVERGRGRVMNVASTAAFLPGPLMAVYYASKAYVLSFSEAIASELKRTGVSVTALCPGPTNTEFQKRAGIENSKLFQINAADSMSVARAAYRAMMAGRTVAITGLANKLMVQALRLAPRRLLPPVVKKLNRSR
jgi:uncharacterized protein